MFQVHFNSDSWNYQYQERTLRESAVPPIFQHNLLLEYVEIVFQKVQSFNISSKAVDDGMQAIQELKAEGVLGNAEVQNELLTFSNLLVTSILQVARTNQKSGLLEKCVNENLNLSKELRKLTSELKNSEL